MEQRCVRGIRAGHPDQFAIAIRPFLATRICKEGSPISLTSEEFLPDASDRSELFKQLLRCCRIALCLMCADVLAKSADPRADRECPDTPARRSLSQSLLIIVSSALSAACASTLCRTSTSSWAVLETWQRRGSRPPLQSLPVSWGTAAEIDATHSVDHTWARQCSAETQAEAPAETQTQRIERAGTAHVSNKRSNDSAQPWNERDALRVGPMMPPLNSLRPWPLLPLRIFHSFSLFCSRLCRYLTAPLSLSYLWLRSSRLSSWLVASPSLSSLLAEATPPSPYTLTGRSSRAVVAVDPRCPPAFATPRITFRRPPRCSLTC